MDVKRITFDSEGDLVFRMTYRREAQSAIEQLGFSEHTCALTASRRADIAPLQTPHSTSDGSDGEDDPEPMPQREVEMLVSSRCMVEASPVFKAMLSGNFSEGQDLQQFGRATVPLSDDDPTAFEILLNIIHGHSTRVPVTVDFETLGALALLVDKWSLSGSVQPYAPDWMLGSPVISPDSLVPDFFGCLNIAWLFKLPEAFQQYTRTAILRSFRRLEMPQTPVFFPEIVLDHIERRRIKALQNMLADLEKMIHSLTTFQPLGLEPEIGICDVSSPDSEALRRWLCGSMMLGSLLQSAALAGLHPAPAAPYDGWSVAEMGKNLAALDIISFCETLKGWEDDDPPRAHGFRLYAGAHEIRNQRFLKGLDVNDLDKEL